MRLAEQFKERTGMVLDAVRTAFLLAAMAGMIGFSFPPPRAGGAPGPTTVPWTWVRFDQVQCGKSKYQVMMDVVADGPGLVAVGYEFLRFPDAPVGADRTVGAVVWTSPDGVRWTRIPDYESVLSGEQTMSAIASRPGRLVAVGSSASGFGDTDAAVWTSTDGIRWSRVPHDVRVFGGPGSQYMADVVAGGPGFVAVGVDGSGSSARAAVWTSVDGVQWNWVQLIDGNLGARMDAVAVGRPGLIAVGRGGLDSGDNHAAVWTSADGVRWNRVPHDEAVFGGTGQQALGAIVEAPTRLVAVGVEFANGGIHAAVWTSLDGARWSRVPHNEAVFGGTGGEAMNDVGIGGPGVIAVGISRDVSGSGDAAVWTSPDGLGWTRMPDTNGVFGGSGDQVMRGVVGGGGRLIAVGFNNRDASVWLSRPSVPGVALDVRIQPPSSLSDFPMSVSVESSPVTWRFSFEQRVMAGSYPIPFPPPTYDVALYELQYVVYDQDNVPYFCDRIDLHGQTGPGSLEVSPGIDLPQEIDRIRVFARLTYRRLLFTALGVPASTDDISVNASDVQLQPAPGNRRYYRYRSGYVKRHLISSGRGLSEVWLKEYEPGRDRKELLYHSRTFKPPRDHTRIYVPWLRECTAGSCGSTVARDADAIYGGDENPLLRGGLAMATFALEYLSDRSTRSLAHALKLLEYFEKSEWVKQDGTRSGFFLRSKFPGGVHHETSSREYFYASADEIVGMTLGLFYLDKALEAAGDTANLQRVEGLVDRLGRQLAHSYYFVIPPPGLPQERHTGWSGTWALQWYLERGFEAITGKVFAYSPPSPHLGGRSIDEHQFWQQVGEMPWNGWNEDDFGLVTAGMRWIDPSPYTRAKTSIQAVGALMYYEGKKAEIPVDCAPDLTIDLTEEDVPRWNFPMLLHAFQPALASPVHPLRGTGERASREILKDEFRKVIVGVLTGGSQTKIHLRNFLASGVLGDYIMFIRVSLGLTTLGVSEFALAVADLFCDWEAVASVGTDVPEDNYYAAAVALALDLPESHPDRDRRAFIRQAIEGVINRVQGDFAPALPVGERNLGLPGAIKHNPSGFLGRTFAWESPPESNSTNWVQGGGGDGGLGLSDRDIESAFCCHGVDVMLEGAGLDYLLPSALLHYTERRFNLSYAENTNPPRLRACSTLVRVAAPFPRANDAPCDFEFPAIEEDRFEANERNDSYHSAKQIEWGVTSDLTIDRVTHRDYFFPTSGVVYAKYTNLRYSRVRRISSEQDRDYFRLVNDQGYGVHVIVQSPSAVIVAVVDGNEAPPVAGDYKKKAISVPPRASHVIMVASPNVTTRYSIQINGLPRAEARAITARAGVPVQVTLRAVDREGDPLTYIIVASPAHGILTGTPPNLTYLPSAGYTGVDQFTFKANDGFGDSNVAVVQIMISP